jgi:hypothetical protein
MMCQTTTNSYSLSIKLHPSPRIIQAHLLIMLKTALLRANRISISQRSLRVPFKNAYPHKHTYWRSQSTVAASTTSSTTSTATDHQPSTVSEELDSEPSSIKATFRKTLEKERTRSLLGGGEHRIAKQHARGSLTARERLDLLFDDGSFREMDQMKVHRCQEFGMDAEENKIPGDGVVTGHVSFVI